MACCDVVRRQKLTVSILAHGLVDQALFLTLIDLVKDHLSIDREFADTIATYSPSRRSLFANFILTFPLAVSHGSEF